MSCTFLPTTLLIVRPHANSFLFMRLSCFTFMVMSKPCRGEEMVYFDMKHQKLILWSISLYIKFSLHQKTFVVRDYKTSFDLGFVEFNAVRVNSRNISYLKAVQNFACLMKFPFVCFCSLRRKETF